jgi:hypothetical protein
MLTVVLIKMENQTRLNQMVVTNDFLPEQFARLPENPGILKGNIKFQAGSKHQKQETS